MLKLIMSMLITLNVSAEPSESVIVRQTYQAGLKATAENLAGDYLNNAKTLPGIGSVTNAGNDVLAGVGIILAGIEFGNAKDDKGRLFATADAAVAVLTVTVPIVGGIAALAMTIIKIADGIISASFQRTLLQIYKRIADHYRRIAELRTMAAQSEIAAIGESIKRIESTNSQLNFELKFIDENCRDANNLQNFGQIDNCLISFSKVISDFKIIVGQSDFIAKFQSEYLDTEEVFKQLGQPREAFTAQVSDKQAQLNGVISKIDQVRAGFKQIVLDLIHSNAQLKSGITKDVQSRDECLQQAMDLTQSSQTLLVNHFTASNFEKAAMDRVSAGFLYEQMKNFSNGTCVDLARMREDTNLNRTLNLYFHEFGAFKREFSL